MVPFGQAMKKTLYVFLSVIFLICCVFFGYSKEFYSREVSPDGKYSVEVYLTKRFFPVYNSPGGGSDAKVVIYLKTANGRVIDSWHAMLQTSGPVVWHDDLVEVGSNIHLWVKH